VSTFSRCDARVSLMTTNSASRSAKWTKKFLVVGQMSATAGARRATVASGGKLPKSALGGAGTFAPGPNRGGVLQTAFDRDVDADEHVA